MTLHIEPYATLSEAVRRALALRRAGQHLPRLVHTGAGQVVVLVLDPDRDRTAAVLGAAGSHRRDRVR